MASVPKSDLEMAFECKIDHRKWMHGRPNARRWKARFRMGKIMPHYALEEFPKLKRMIVKSDYLPHMDAYQRLEFMR